MVKIYLDMNDGFIHYKMVNELLFSTLNSLFRTEYCKYNPSDKAWMLKPSLRAYNLYLKVKEYTGVIISHDDLDLLEYCIYPSSSEVKRIKLNPDTALLEKHPPMTGIHPFEDFQKEAIIKSIRQNKIILDIEMRHGKTYIACMAIGTLIKLKQIDRVLLICRPEGVENFRLELLRFLDGLISEDDIAVITTKNRQIEDFFDKKIIITNYITYRITCNYYQKLGEKHISKKPKKPVIDFDKWSGKKMLVLDECQAINNYDSLQSHFIHLHGRYFDRIIEMSGSIGYKFLQMYSLCKLLVPNQIPYTFAEWRDYVSTNFGRDIIPEKVKEFKEKVIDKLMITYHNCIPQSSNIENQIYCAMSSKMRDIYQAFCSSFVNGLLKISKGTVSGNSVLMKFNYLTQITSDPCLLDISGWNFEDNPKLEVLDSLLEKYIDDENRKVIIWACHPDTLNRLAIHLARYNPLVIHGDEKTSVKRENRIEEINKFKKNSNSKILLCNYVLATSISLVECTAQIYWDLTDNPDYWAQSMKRIQGPMQKKQVNTDILMFDKSVDVYCFYEILQKKIKTKNLISAKNSLSLDDYKLIFNPSRNYYIDGSITI